MEASNISDKLIPANPNAYSFLRILTGLIILIRGFNFIFITSNLKSMIEANLSMFAGNSGAWAIIVAVLNIACGLFITVGFATRISAVIQIPILFIAAFLVNMKHLGENSFEFILSLIAFILVVIVAYKRSGPFSADEYFRRGAAIDRGAENPM